MNTLPPGVEPLTGSKVHELCNDVGLDWHRGWSIDTEPNRYLQLAKSVESLAARAGYEAGLEAAAKSIEPDCDTEDWTEFAGDCAMLAKHIRSLKGKP